MKPLQSGLTAQKCLEEFKSILGNKTFYRGLALTPSDYSNLLMSSSMSATEAKTEKDSIKSVKKSVEHHLLKWRDEKSPILSVTEYPDVATVVTKGYARDADKLVYVFEIELPKLDTFGYRETFGAFSKELEPKKVTTVLENLGEKKKVVMQNTVNGVREAVSWDVYDQSTIVREVAYDSRLESFVYGEIPSSYIRSVKVFSEAELRVYDMRPILPTERVEVFAQFKIGTDPKAKTRFLRLFDGKIPLYSATSHCSDLLNRSFDKLE
ncbi:MAG: hypothetical protein KA715_01265 [Xanthomonadaceae bacterium]|nr:hypothetical protein [Xanthomonadaceae bacterium]